MTSVYDEHRELVVAMLAEGASYRIIADAIGAPSRSAVAGFVRRSIRGKKDGRRDRPPGEGPLRSDARWTETRLTETWAQRKRRRARERAADKSVGG